MGHADYCARFLAPQDVVLDIGSGRGVFLCNMAAKGFRAYGVEAHSAYIQDAETEAARRGVNVSFVQAKAELLPYTDTMFQFVNCAEVTEHVEDPVALCREMYRVMKIGGHGYISFHNRFGAFDYHYHLFGINWMPRVWAEYVLRLLGKEKTDKSDIGRQKLSTMHYYPYKRALTLLQSIGFHVKDIREEKILSYYPRAAWAVLLVYRMILRPLYFNSFHLLVQK